MTFGRISNVVNIMALENTMQIYRNDMVAEITKNVN